MASDVETGAATDKWALYSGGFYMRAADGEDGKLARLVDVRDWLMRRHEWPMDRAANEVISALNQGVENGCALFIADTKRYAVAMREDAHFLSLDEIKERGGLRHIDERLLGFKGLCNAILNGWVGEYAGYLHSGRLDAACVTLKDAQELWGWGTVSAAGSVAAVPVFPLADWPALVDYRKANPGSDWGQGNQVAIGKNELALRVENGKTESDALAEMAHEVRLKSRQAMHKALNHVRKRAKKKEMAAAAQPVTQVHDGKRQPKAA